MATKKPKKNPGGRPRLPGARRETFCIRITADELALLEKAAAPSGKAVRTWARDRLLRGLKSK
jgi:hypothetical protein